MTPRELAGALALLVLAAFRRAAGRRDLDGSDGRRTMAEDEAGSRRVTISFITAQRRT